MAALERLADVPRMQVCSRSRWFDTKPVGGPAGQPGFLNGAAVLETDLPPVDVVRALLSIENQLGRQRAGRWQPRELDLDLLLYDDLVVRHPEVAVPHPWMAVRRFVLEPAAEIAPAMLHPPTGWCVARLLDNLNLAHQYVAVASSNHGLADRFAVELAKRSGATLLNLGPCTAEGVPPQNSTTKSWLELGTCWATELSIDAWPAAAAPRGAAWAVSARWLGEPLVAARMTQHAERSTLPADPRGEAEIDHVWAEVTARAVAPKLILAVEDLHPATGPSPATAGDNYAACLAAELDRPGHGPVLRLACADWNRAIDDGLAALAAAM